MATKKIVLVTGANTGIGYETVKALLQSPTSYHILVGSRSEEKGEAAVEALRKEFPSSVSDLEVLQIDIHSDESIDAAFKVVGEKHGRVDVLVNNAGATYDTWLKDNGLTLREQFNKSYDVNTSGTHVMTHVFVPLLLKSADPRLLFVTSGLSSLQGCSQSLMPRKIDIPAGWPKPQAAPMGYRASKAALNMVMLSWHWVLEKDGVKTWCISPGMLATSLGGDPELLKKMGAGDPALGGEFIREVVEGKRDADVGKVVNSAGVQPW